MATSLEELEKEVQIDHSHANTYHLVKKIVKIGQVNPELIGFQLKKIRNKLRNVKYIAWSASLPRGINNLLLNTSSQ